MREMQLFLGGELRDGVDWITVRSPFDGREVAKVARGGPAELERAAAVAHRIASVKPAPPARERAAVLERAAALVGERRDSLAEAIC
ncbi:MAG TPA: aldehyde dehydrogenase family protein, partial [Chondromyces sp.]|nr:aldehyde dehydrogenase family protein [Chondromyces sp.]